MEKIPLVPRSARPTRAPLTPLPWDVTELSFMQQLSRLSTLLRASIESGDWAEPLPVPHTFLLYMLLTAQPWPQPLAAAAAVREHPAVSHTLTGLAYI